MCGQVRFYCDTSAHSRTVHFKMSNDAIRRTMFDGYRVNPNFATEHTLLTGGESAYLPGATTNIYSGGSYDGFTGEPFYKLHNYHFNTRFNHNGGYRWECDDAVLSGGGYQHTTTHQVWVRLSALLSQAPTATRAPSAQPSEAPSAQPSAAPTPGTMPLDLFTVATGEPMQSMQHLTGYR